MPPRLHFVTGKGGVGKSTVAAALATAAATRGARVLAIELGEAAGLCRALGVRPSEPGEPAAAGDVHVAYLDGSAALAEYLRRRVHLPFARSVIVHPMYAAFVAAAPGLRELMTIGKIRDELVLQQRWDVIVVDAGSSGHALEYLRMPAAAAAAFARGRIHREAGVNADLLRDPRASAIHVVATPEEMPLREAIQTVAALRGLGLAIGRVIANRCLPPAPAGVDAALARVTEPAVGAVLRRARDWEAIQERGIAVLEGELATTTLRVPRLRGATPVAVAPHVAGVLA